MKLKTKFQDEDFDLGEVVEANVYYGGNGRIKVITEPTRGGMITFYFETLKGMNEMFEDYEEPKEYWWIDWAGGINHTIPLDDSTGEYEDNKKEIGNYFETKEEAELAVRKLKAWKRLKDKGFEFTKWEAECTSGKGTISTNFNLWEGLEEEVVEDLDLLFRREDE